MPRPSLAYGRPGSKLLPPQWSRAHAPVAAQTRTGELSIFESDVHGGYDEELMQETITPGALVLSTTGRLQQIEGDKPNLIADQRVSTRTYLLSIDLDADTVQIGHVARFTRCDDDPSLLDVTLVVTDVQRGTVRWQRDLRVIENMG